MAGDSRSLASGDGTLTRRPFRGHSSGRSDMFRQLLEGILLIALTVAIHGSVLGWSIGRLRLNVAGHRTFFADTWLLSRLAVWAVLAHLLEITVWGLYY